MEGNIKKIKDPSGNGIYPITRGEAVYIEDNKTLNQRLTEIGNNSGYNLPTASSSVLGGVKIGSGLTITNGVLNATAVSGGSGGGLVYKGLLSSNVPNMTDNFAGYFNDALTDGIYLVQQSNLPIDSNPPIYTDFYLIHRDMPLDGFKWAWQEVVPVTDLGVRYIRRCLKGSSRVDGRQGKWTYIGSDELLSKVSGKKLLTIGDSITAKWGGDPIDAVNYPQSMIPFKAAYPHGNAGYQIEFMKRLRLDVWTLGRGGAKMARTPTFTHYDPYSFAMITRPPNATNKGDTGGINLTGFDYITIKYGTNDAAWDIALGTIDSEDTETFMGAMNVGIQQIYAQNPRIQIFFITSPPRFDQFTETSDLQERWRLNQEMNKPYVDACLAVCEKWNIPCFDSSKNSGINYYNHSAYMNVDRIHYDDYTLWGGRMAEWLKKYL